MTKIADLPPSGVATLTLEYQRYVTYDVEYDDHEYLEDVIEDLKLGDESNATYVDAEDNYSNYDIAPA